MQWRIVYFPEPTHPKDFAVDFASRLTSLLCCCSCQTRELGRQEEADLVQQGQTKLLSPELLLQEREKISLGF